MTKENSELQIEITSKETVRLIVTDPKGLQLYDKRKKLITQTFVAEFIGDYKFTFLKIIDTNF